MSIALVEGEFTTFVQSSTSGTSVVFLVPLPDFPFLGVYTVVCCFLIPKLGLGTAILFLIFKFYLGGAVAGLGSYSVFEGFFFMLGSSGFSNKFSSFGSSYFSVFFCFVGSSSFLGFSG